MTKVTLLQTGARHDYAMARFLHREHMLQRIYTDFAFGDGLLPDLVRTIPAPRRIKDPLERRIARDIPAALIDSAVYRRFDDRLTPIEPWAIQHRDAIETDIYYAQYYCGALGLRERLPRAVKIVSDVFVIPSTHTIVNAEAEAFPEWNEPAFSADACARMEHFTNTMFADSDWLFCPARSVIDDITRIDPALAAKCVLVPYGSSMRFAEEPAPVPGRVLFAGALSLRKGVHYLAEAAALIARIDPSIHFVFAGHFRPEVRELMSGSNIELLGQVSRERLAQEFLKADVFAFPSLAEGSAGTALEALAAGLPLVATRSAGVDFDDGEAGIYVEERNCEQLAGAILKVVHDRALRQQLSDGARRHSQSYGMAEWQQAYCDNIRRVAAS